ncbi:MAG TPA: YqgE/AlgH family protein [Spongiibacteraceae bacterium]|nr:YqgE/AlgH family protein [Spongiibacteraceae bacterium]HCS29168.1 YqgE/AlgH family protein [Spongiibacteraceae bacterium]
MSKNSLKNHFLLATPTLGGGFFANSLTYLCEHSEDGAMGIVINHPLDVRVDEILDQLSLADAAHPQNEPVLAGGPLYTDRGFVLHYREQSADGETPNWQATMDVSSEIQLTTSLDILGAIAQDRGPSRKLIALGYAGWAPGQLEDELEDNAWLTVPADEHILFAVPHHKKLDAALKKLGISLSQLAPHSGHA